MCTRILTLGPNTELMYLVDKTYSPDHELVIRWDDQLCRLSGLCPTGDVGQRQVCT